MISGAKLIAVAALLTTTNLIIVEKFPKTVNTLVLALLLSVVSGIITGGLTYLSWIRSQKTLKEGSLHQKSDSM